MTRHDPSRRATMAEIGAGAREVLPIVLGAVPFGMLFGAVAAEADFSVANTVLMSLIVYSGTTQLVGLNMIVAGTPWLLIALASLIVNSRHLFYSAALTPHVRGLSIRWRILLAYGMTDQIYALAERRYNARDGSAAKQWYVLTASALLFVAWLASTYVGFEFGDVLERFDGLGLDFAIYATLVALAAPSIGDICSVAAGLTAGSIALLLAPVQYQGGVFLGILAGVAGGVLCERCFPIRRKGHRHEEPATGT